MWKIINRRTNEIVKVVETRKELKGYHKYPFQIINIGENNIMSNMGLFTKIKLLRDNAKIPTQADEGSAGFDLYAAIDEPITIAPHTTKKVGTGFALELPIGVFGAIVARSGLATKKGLRPANCLGVCDPSYRGEYIIALHNDTDSPQTIEPNERIAQLLLLGYLLTNFKVVDELSDTERGEGGFGHSGTK